MITLMDMELEEVKYTSFQFSGGELQVKVEDSVQNISHVTFSPTHPSEIMELLLLVDALRRDGHSIHDLHVPYVPYARQDRVMQRGEALSIKVFCDLINSMKFSRVTVFDPHSDVTAALLENVCVVGQDEIIQEHKVLNSQLQWGKYNAIVAPDAGAMKKASAVAKQYNLPVIFGTKHRDVSTGEITGTTVTGDCKGRLLMVDDIADGARTFIELAKVCKASGAEEVDLFVTHGIFSKGVSVVKEHINTIYSTTSWGNVTHAGVIY